MTTRRSSRDVNLLGHRRDESSWMPRTNEKWLGLTANPPTGGCHDPGSKHPRKVGNHLKTLGKVIGSGGFKSDIYARTASAE